ncbi:MAG: preprotein translocase subunit SecY [Streptococcaceae bacterium]|jgi:preprotein translocase subunit SecY|nr:preprotein translocase subunit SecY [Streptococcaceae bacterium]
MFFKLLWNGFKLKEVRNRVMFTVGILFVFRLGTHITVPGIDASKLQSLANLPFFQMFNMVSGNGLQTFSLFAMGVSPYITASIIVQLLQMDILPVFVEWGKQGEIGRRKLNQATRYITLALAMGQSIGITAGFQALTSAKIVANPNWQTYVMIGIILTAGSMIVTWMGEQINDKGFGSGVSLVIFAGIVASIPDSAHGIYVDWVENQRPDLQMQGWINIGVLVAVAVLIIWFTTWVQQAERKVPIQYTKLTQGAPSSSYLPLRVNPAGVIPVIFASTISTAPPTILQFLQKANINADWLTNLQNIMATSGWTGMSIYGILIIVFTFFYSFVQINPEKMSDQLTQSGAYIPSVRPGKGTEKYISGLLIRLATVGSLFLGVISIIPMVAQNLWGLPQIVALGGTSLLIIIMTAIQGVEQLEGYMLKKQYVGFMDDPVVD